MTANLVVCFYSVIAIYYRTGMLQPKSTVALHFFYCTLRLLF